MMNRPAFGRISAIISLLTFLCAVGRAESAAPKSPEITLVMEPVRYVAINGDAAQFRAHHWMSTSYAGGVKEFSFEDELPDGVSISMEGHAIPNNGDYGGELKLTKEELGYLLFDYKQFRKYYNASGGVFNGFSVLSSNDTDKDLSLNIGEFSAEAGLRRENLPELTLNYTREFKTGTKSRLSWTSVTVGPTASGGSPDVLRKIGPSWQEIDEIVDKFDIKAEDDFAGFNWQAEQGWEYVRSRNTRQEKYLSNTPNGASGSNSDQRIRDQVTEPRSDLITTVLGLNRWFMKDKLYTSSGYRFSQINSRELENIFEYDQNGRIRSFSNAEQVRDAHSDNLFTTNTWVGNVTAYLMKTFSVSTKTKVESIERTSASTYPKDRRNGATLGTDASPIVPDGIMDQVDVSENQNKMINVGEGVYLRFTGIPRTAIYNEYEFQQTRNKLYEDRRSNSAGEVFNREDISHMYRGSGVLGASFIPWDTVTLTSDVRHREDQINYNHVHYSNDSTSGAKSVFIDGQYIQTDELSTKIRLKPCRWFQPSFRYQYQNKGYETWGLSDSDNRQESGITSHIYTVDIVIQPTDSLLTTTSFSTQRGRMFTPADNKNPSTPLIPTYNFDVLTALFSAEYAFKEDLVLTGITQWSDAGDFNNLGGILSYGADYTEFDLSVGLRWTPKKDMTIEPKYSYYRYDPSPDLEVGGYNASVISLDVNFKWG